MASPAQVRATTKYIKEHTRRFVVQCNNERDADIIGWLSEKGNVNGYIKDLIRKDMQEKI